MAFNDLNTPPHKKRRLMQQSQTEISHTPSPPITPRWNHNQNNKNVHPFSLPLIPQIKSTPIRNYFARFSDSNHNSSNKSHKTNKVRFKNLSLSPHPLSAARFNQIHVDPTKYDEFYHPLCDIISNRTDLNIFSEAYCDDRPKKYYDHSPFLDPKLQLKMRDDLLQLLCDTNDNIQKSSKLETNYKAEDNDYVFVDEEDQNDDTQHANDMLQKYGEAAITNILHNIPDCEVADTKMDRAQQLVEYLETNDDNRSSYDDIKEGMIYLSGVLEYITATVLDSAGLMAQQNHSITETEDHHADIVQNTMDEHHKMVSKYDVDMFHRDIDRECVIIRPSHIRHAIANDDELFWLQQAIQIRGEAAYIGNKHVSDIRDALNMDCVYHICSFFGGDLPMLSSLARVNSTFYVMTAKNNLWKPIAIRCFLFNPLAVRQIEDNYNEEDDECYDFRGYISLPNHVKITVLRERWMKQDRKARDLCDNGAFEIYVRINPVYDLHTKMYNLLYMNVEHEDVDLYLDHETYDLLRQLLEIFGTRNDFITISEILNHSKCLTYNQMEQRLDDMFGNRNLNTNEQNDLDKVMQMEYRNNGGGLCSGQLFVELPLSQSCLHEDVDDEKHYLWIGRNIVVFATIEDVTHKHFNTLQAL